MRGLCPLIFFSLILNLTACSEPSASLTQKNKPHTENLEVQKLTIATADASGAYQSIGQTMGQIYQKQFLIPVETKTTNGAVENLNLLKNNQADLAFVMNDVLNDAIQGQAEFKQPLSNIVQIATLYPSYMQLIVPAHSSIQGLKDLKGKRIAVSAQSTRTETNAKRVLASVGLERNQYKMWFFGHAEAIDAFKNKQIDAAIFNGQIPNQAISRLIADGFSIRFVGIQDTEFAQLQRQHSYFISRHIAANSYGTHAAIPTVAVMHSLVARQALSQHDVHALTQSLFEHLPQIQEAHPSAKAIQVDAAQTDLIYALHAGALQYYQQKH